MQIATLRSHLMSAEVAEEIKRLREDDRHSLTTTSHRAVPGSASVSLSVWSAAWSTPTTPDEPLPERAEGLVMANYPTRS